MKTLFFPSNLPLYFTPGPASGSFEKVCPLQDVNDSLPYCCSITSYSHLSGKMTRCCMMYPMIANGLTPLRSFLLCRVLCLVFIAGFSNSCIRFRHFFYSLIHKKLKQNCNFILKKLYIYIYILFIMQNH